MDLPPPPADLSDMPPPPAVLPPPPVPVDAGFTDSQESLVRRLEALESRLGSGSTGPAASAGQNTVPMLPLQNMFPSGLLSPVLSPRTSPHMSPRESRSTSNISEATTGSGSGSATSPSQMPQQPPHERRQVRFNSKDYIASSGDAASVEMGRLALDFRQDANKLRSMLHKQSTSPPSATATAPGGLAGEQQTVSPLLGSLDPATLVSEVHMINRQLDHVTALLTNETRARLAAEARIQTLELQMRLLSEGGGPTSLTSPSGTPRADPAIRDIVRHLVDNLNKRLEAENKARAQLDAKIHFVYDLINRGAIRKGRPVPDMATVVAPTNQPNSISRGNATKTGWLSKRGRVRQNWKTRFFVLTGSELQYFVNEHDEWPKGAIALDGCAVVLPEGDGRDCMELITQDRRLLFRAQNEEAAREWIAALNSQISLLDYQKKCRAQGTLPDGRVMHYAGLTSLTKVVLDNEPFELSACQALASMVRHRPVISLSMRNARLSDLHMQILVEAIIHNDSLIELNFQLNEIGPDGAAHLARAIVERQELGSNSLVIVRLGDNRIGSDGCQSMSRILHPGSRIKHLDLCNNDIEDVTALALALKPNAAGLAPILPELTLTRNKLGDEAAQQIAEVLRVNKAIRVVKLAYNNIDDAGGIAIAHALEHNSVVTRIELGHNTFQSSGSFALFSMLKSNRTIEYIDFANLTLDQNSIGVMFLLRQWLEHAQEHQPH